MTISGFSVAGISAAAVPLPRAGGRRGQGGDPECGPRSCFEREVERRLSERPPPPRDADPGGPRGASPRARARRARGSATHRGRRRRAGRARRFPLLRPCPWDRRACRAGRASWNPGIRAAAASEPLWRRPGSARRGRRGPDTVTRRRGAGSSGRAWPCCPSAFRRRRRASGPSGLQGGRRVDGEPAPGGQIPSRDGAPGPRELRRDARAPVSHPVASPLRAALRAGWRDAVPHRRGKTAPPRPGRWSFPPAPPARRCPLAGERCRGPGEAAGPDLPAGLALPRRLRGSAAGSPSVPHSTPHTKNDDFIKM
ncbi:collagen alpha-1(I) chain-like [Homo sapiens]|uniref:collagen alpha-1(I) chain-like n=1 Tax=Homo sapiens TaxID=9606 RepID=UPI001FB194AC|nr:collagen alpha-1(I) chain-like [Homo sapiens]